MTEEIWKDVIGYEGLYEVSSIGRIRSYAREKTRFLTPSLGNAGYYRVTLSKNGSLKVIKNYNWVQYPNQRIFYIKEEYFNSSCSPMWQQSTNKPEYIIREVQDIDEDTVKFLNHFINMNENKDLN